MDVVELTLENPVLLAVVDEKFAVGRDLGGLDGTQVGAKDTSGWMFISKFD
jgi:hypothetical protein